MENPYITLDSKFLTFVQKLLNQIFEDVRDDVKYKWVIENTISFKVVDGDRDRYVHNRVYIDMDFVVKSSSATFHLIDLFETKLREKTGLRFMVDLQNQEIIENIKESFEIPLDRKKKYFYSYWRKHGARLDPIIYEIVGEQWGTGKFFDISIDWLQEFLGGKESAYDKAMTIIESSTHKIEDCSSYQLNYNFRIDEVTFFPSDNLLQIGVEIDDNGYFMKEGKKYNISQLEDDFFTEYTFQNCLDEHFENLDIFYLTGINLNVYVSGSY